MKRETIITNINSGKPFIFTRGFTRDLFDKKIRLFSETKTPEVHFFDTSYDLLCGSFKNNIKFVFPDGSIDFLMYSANSGYALPQQVIVGTVVNGEVHLIRELCPLTQYTMTVIRIPNADLFDKKVKGYLPRKEICSFSPCYNVTKCDRNSVEHPLAGTNALGEEDTRRINNALQAKKRIKKYLISLQ